MPAVKMYAKRVCTYPGCNALVQGINVKRCEKHSYEKSSQPYTASARAADTRSEWYNTQAWARARVAFLRAHPLCEQCKRDGRLTPSTDVDHIVPHRGDVTLFNDVNNLQALCRSCHSRKTATEDGGFGRVPVRAQTQ